MRRCLGTLWACPCSGQKWLVPATPVCPGADLALGGGGGLGVWGGSLQAGSARSAALGRMLRAFSPHSLLPRGPGPPRFNTPGAGRAGLCFQQLLPAACPSLCTGHWLHFSAWGVGSRFGAPHRLPELLCRLVPVSDALFPSISILGLSVLCFPVLLSPGLLSAAPSVLPLPPPPPRSAGQGPGLPANARTGGTAVTTGTPHSRCEPAASPTP